MTSIMFVPVFKEFYNGLDEDQQCYIRWAVVCGGYCTFENYNDILAETPSAEHRYMMARDYNGEQWHAPLMPCDPYAVDKLANIIHNVPVTRATHYVSDWIKTYAILETIVNTECDNMARTDDESVLFALECNIGRKRR